MRRILLVHDDPLVLRIYGDGLRLRGFEVDRAEDGLAAATSLQKAKPDAIVLDLMMPRFSGLDLLKYVRSQPDLAKVPVVVLSNAYMANRAGEAAAAGADKALIKVDCTPAIMAETLNRLLNGEDTSGGGTQLARAPAAEPSGAPAPSPRAAPSPSPTGAGTRQLLPPESQAETRDMAKVRENFLERGPATLSALRSLFHAFHTVRNDAGRRLLLGTVYTKVHFLTVAARVAECYRLTQMASVLEALLLELISCPSWISPSVVRTIAMAVDFLGVLFEHDREGAPGSPPEDQTPALVLDDDAVCRNVIITALRNAHFKPEGASDPVSALPWLSNKRYGLIILDIEMPGMDGLEFCRRARQLPGYQRTPVIYVTAHSEFEDRVKGALSGGQDLIAKPIFPLELAVKAVTQTLKFQLPASPDQSKTPGV